MSTARWPRNQAIPWRCAAELPPLRHMELDATDRRLIAELRANGRAPAAHLAKRIGISRSTVEKRLARLVDGGVILGFTVRARDHHEAMVQAVMLIEVAGRSTSAVIRELKALPELYALHTTNGAWDLIADIHARTLSDFDRVLRDVRSIDGVLNSETSIKLSSI